MIVEKIGFLKQMLTVITALVITVGAGTVNLYYKGTHDIIFFAGGIAFIGLMIEGIRIIVKIKKTLKQEEEKLCKN